MGLGVTIYDTPLPVVWAERSVVITGKVLADHQYGVRTRSSYNTHKTPRPFLHTISLANKLTFVLSGIHECPGKCLCAGLSQY